MKKEIKCKACGNSMDARAVVCPSCGVKNKKPIYKRWWVWVIAAAVVIGIASSAGNRSDAPVNTGTPAGSADTSSPEVQYAVGDTIETDKFSLVLSSVDTRTSIGTQYLNTQPAEGGIYVIVDWSYKNITDKPIDTFSCPTIHLVDANGTEYDEDLTASAYYATEAELDSKVLSDVNPGITVKDGAVFEVSAEIYNAGGFSVKIDADKDILVPVN